jgi:hypothetical protein
MQGWHQLAQKFSTTGLPRNWLSDTVRSASVMVKLGAAFPMRGGRGPLQATSRTAQNRAIEEAKRFTLL